MTIAPKDSQIMHAMIAIKTEATTHISLEDPVTNNAHIEWFLFLI